MESLPKILDQLAQAPTLGYSAGQRPATEPTSIAALALAGHGRSEPALVAARWLLKQQASDGSLGIREGDAEPRWPTSLAVLVWRRVAELASSQESREYTEAIERAAEWLFTCRGHTMDRSPDMGHDTTIVAWPWVEGTHAWMEPTAFAVLALKAAGRREHERTREAVRMLIDRLLPDGGCNYGNTSVLGQVLRPHLLPSSITLVALAGEADPSHRIEKTVRLVRGQLSESSPVLSLSWGIVGLAAHGALPKDADRWLEAAARRADRPNRLYRAALLAFAALRDQALPVEARAQRDATLRQKD